MENSLRVSPGYFAAFKADCKRRQGLRWTRGSFAAKKGCAPREIHYFDPV